MLDSRTRILLITLDRCPTLVPAGKVFSQHTCDVTMTGSLLRNARAQGYVECEKIKRQNFWGITPAGRAAIREKAE